MDGERFTLTRAAKTCTVRAIDMTVANLSRIFQIHPQTIYLVERDSADVVFPSHDYFSHVDLSTGATYKVEGQDHLAPVPAMPAPIPARAGAGSGVRFHFPPQNALARPPPPPPPPKKYSRPVAVAQMINGQVNLNSIVTSVTFTEEQANVDGIANAVKSALDSELDIILTDGSGRRILSSPGTTGLDFWRRGARKIVAFRQDLFDQFCRIKRKRSSNSDLTGVAGVIEEFIQVAETLPTVAAEMREVGRMNLSREQLETLRATFCCLICRAEMEGPTLSLCCRSLIGCQDCIAVLLERGDGCPKCRSPLSQGQTVAVAGLSEALAIVRGLGR